MYEIKGCDTMQQSDMFSVTSRTLLSNSQGGAVVSARSPQSAREVEIASLEVRALLCYEALPPAIHGSYTL